MKTKLSLFLYVSCLLWVQEALGQKKAFYKQEPLGVPFIEMGSSDSDSLSRFLEATFVPLGVTLSEAQNGHFSPIDALRRARYPNTMCWVRFGITNQLDKPISKWLVLNQLQQGYFRLYQLGDESINSCEGGAGRNRKLACANPDYHNSVQLNLAARDTLICYLLIYKKTKYIVEKNIYLLDEKEFNHYNSAVDQQLDREKGFLSITVSLMFFTCCFFTFHYLFSGSKIFLWYALYLLAISLYFLKHLEALLDTPILFGHFPRIPIATEMPWTGLITVTYIKFVLDFFSLRDSQPTHYLWFKIHMWISIVQIATSITLDLFFFENKFSTPFFETNHILNTAFQIYGIMILAKTPGIPFRLVFMGSIVLSLTTGLTSFLSYEVRKVFFEFPIGMIQIGAIVEVLFFSAALGFKMRQIEKDRKAYEQIRKNISSDLHDEVGSTLSSIAILSAALQRKMASEDNYQSMGKITERTKQVMDTMSDIVWSVNPMNDQMDRIVIHMCEWAAEVLEEMGIEYSFEANQTIEKLHLPMELRKDFYLLFKEAINNIAKYSEASQVWVKITKIEQEISLAIKDNGKGFEVEKVKHGNGLKNMANRAKRMQANLKIESTIGKGTLIQLSFPLT